VDLTVEYEGTQQTVAEGTTATIGADAAATVQIPRPGISRRHVILKHNGSHWVVQDASSRNGTFHSGSRVQSLDVEGVTSIQLGHPTEGPEVILTPADDGNSTKVATKVTDAVSADEVPSFQLSAPPPAKRPELDLDPRLDNLIDALNDSVSSIRGLTWSVWAMIAVTAALVVLTLFVAILGN
jgi:pSer/pThr/pTyr-binding forkhead associated (FHA) protein